MILNESYDKINNKFVKDDSDFKHYTNYENFSKIVKYDSLKGWCYPANTFNYGKGTTNGTELCLTRSDRSPDNDKSTDITQNIGDIKFTFKKDILERKFGKVKPIDEFPVQALFDINNLIEKIKKNAFVDKDDPKDVERFNLLLKDLKNNCFKWDKPTVEKKLVYFEEYLSRKLYNDLKKDLLQSIPKNWNAKEKMESRIRLKPNENLSLDYVDKIMIPDYLKDVESIKRDVKILKSRGRNVVFYHCRFPKEKQKLIRDGVIKEESYFNY